MQPIVDYTNSGVKPDVRTLGDLRSVLYSKEVTDNPGRELYYMYRGLSSSEKDRKAMHEAGLRYDITVVKSGLIGEEFVKTLGHYHPLIPGTDLTYTEIYQVLEGFAHYLLQKEEAGVVSEVVVVEASLGDVVVIPPNYGHITINLGAGKLVMANWVADGFASDYDPIKSRGGGAYFELEEEGFVKNPSYGNVPELCFALPNGESFGFRKGVDMYSFVDRLKDLDFLKQPWYYPELSVGLF